MLIAGGGQWLDRAAPPAHRAPHAVGLWRVRRAGVGACALLDAHAPVWQVVPAGLAFLYPWWLGILIFDLAFVWHRYIRNSVAVRTLSEWYRGQDAWPDVTLRKKPADYRK